mmetsp:Transcript_23599/g.60141  ORF Transcript_23599/g.60141 Transcript_23599/m.60141 type:complete len:236 (-) Transcript_23599:737-1444(-)
MPGRGAPGCSTGERPCARAARPDGGGCSGGRRPPARSCCRCRSSRRAPRRPSRSRWSLQRPESRSGAPACAPGSRHRPWHTSRSSSSGTPRQRPRPSSPRQCPPWPRPECCRCWQAHPPSAPPFSQLRRSASSWHSGARRRLRHAPARSSGPRQERHPSPPPTVSAPRRSRRSARCRPGSKPPGGGPARRWRRTSKRASRGWRPRRTTWRWSRRWRPARTCAGRSASCWPSRPRH